MVNRWRSWAGRWVHRFATVVGVVAFAAVVGVVWAAFGATVVAVVFGIVVGVGGGGISPARASSVALGCKYTGVGAGIMPSRVVAAAVMFWGL